MKTFIFSSLIFLSLLFSAAIYQRYTLESRASYWLEFSNKAVVNKDASFIEFYKSFQYDLLFMTIEDGWALYERFSNKH